ncbi:alpha-L-rhamnosidase [Tessaracoccus lacteus]|uniref:alpha-L-rhamnosidase n=1 Tax=Tessaracoccus lacteus TaxID=3041766 RepID=A0ABY8PV63_9ACTN|nr:alpha-L-rhamnosidase [Tessaracoccus sp. T21]WGT46341.1 family 78 glycoside hydrolase catalytic domain [Tessaracoccus sp. T21]
MPHIEVASPRLEHGPAVAANPTPRISWVTTTAPDGWRQLAAEVSFATDDRTVTVTLEGPDQVLVAWPFAPLAPRQRGELKVRVRGEEGWSPWSAPAPVWATFLGADEWQASFVGLPDPVRQAQPAVLRRGFTVREGLTNAIWYATAHGAYQARVNGTEVDDQILKPGWTPYQFRLVHETTDVTSLLQTGENSLDISLTGGWYCEEFGFQGQSAPFYGDQPSVAGQLRLEYADGSTEWIVTDGSWHASGSGPLVSAGLYVGETYDARRTATDWGPAAVRDAGVKPGPRTSPAVRVTGTVPVQEVITSPSGRTILDFGQNLVGRLRITVRGEAGDVVTLRHAEVLEDGELGVRPLRRATSTDRYTLVGDGEESYAPTFTFHGFRYAEVSGWPGEFDPADVVAEVVGSDLRRTGWFECSDSRVNRLHENVVWGMRSNFLYLPTDCPQRDERLGWTGDIQVFAPTASFLFDCDAFLASWLEDLALEQRAAGGVPFIVPDVLGSGTVPAAAWGDAATVVPSVLYERFADRVVVERQYPSMQAWVEQLLAIAGERRLWEGGFQFGDWVDPDAPPEDPAKAKADPDLVASGYLYRSTTLLARAAALLGKDAEAAHYAAVAEEVRAAWQREYVTPAGRLLSDAQTAYALAIEFGLVDGELRAQMGDRLADLVRRDGYHIGTGFVGTPIIADALSGTGHIAQAGRMLLQTECPSWLYSVEMGATTIWERWDSMLPDGSINPGEMTSFNHYALGSIADWLHRVVGGLAPAEPGFRRVRLQPTPVPGLDSASSTFDGPYGLVSVAWRREGDDLLVTAQVPPNTTADVVLPGRDPFEVASGSHEWRVAWPLDETVPAAVDIDTSLAEIQDDPEAYAAVIGAFEGIDPVVAEDFRLRTRWQANQSLRSAFALISPTVAGAVADELVRLNERRGLAEVVDAHA